jgi:hypothetical protein
VARAPEADHATLPMSAEPLPTDPALAALRRASDRDEMLELFRQHLRPVSTSYDIEGCRLSRIHYHRGDRCGLRYTLRVVDHETGRERSQWVTGLIYAGDRAARVWRKLRASDPRREIPQAFPTFEPLAFLPELQLIAQVFPYDRHLPGLPRLTLAPPPDLEPLFLAQLGPGSGQIASCRVAPVQYRIGRAAVLRYEVEARAGSSSASAVKTYYAKVYRREEQAERARRVLRALADRPEAGPGFAVPEPLAYLSELRTLVQDEARGTSLRQLVSDGDEGSAVREVARALSAFRREPVRDLPRHRLDGELAALKAASELLGCACPQIAARLEAVAAAIAARLDEVPAEPTHGELKSSHLFVSGDGVAVVDLDSCAASDPMLDPARLLADLAGLRLRAGDGGRWQVAADAFADAYLSAVPRPAHRRLVPHYAAALLKEAVDFFRHLEPGWPEKVPILVEEAENALSRREW